VRCRSCKLCFTLKIQKAQIQPPCHIWHPSPPPKVACIDVREISHALVSVKCLMSVLCICDIPHSYVTWLVSKGLRLVHLATRVYTILTEIMMFPSHAEWSRRKPRETVGPTNLLWASPRIINSSIDWLIH